MRVFVQIDVQNIFFAAKDVNRKIDFLKIRDHFMNSRDQVVGLNAYIIRTPDAPFDRFEAMLKNNDYNLVIKQASISRGSDGSRIYKGTDHDMAIAIDCLTNMDKFDKWVLMSGDGDFMDLCKHLKKHGKIVEIWSMPGKSFNKLFCSCADVIVFFNDSFLFDKPEASQDEKSRGDLPTVSPAS